MSRPIYAANWKMNHGPTDAREFLRSFLHYYPRQSDRQVILFPSTIALAAVVEGLKDRSDIRVGVQNIHWEAKGAFTGEISGSMARDAGAHYALVGHSERRHVFGETDEQAGRKVQACFRAGLTPMLCVGETLEERESGDTEIVVLRQLRAGLSGIDPVRAQAHVPGQVLGYSDSVRRERQSRECASAPGGSGGRRRSGRRGESGSGGVVLHRPNLIRGVSQVILGG